MTVTETRMDRDRYTEFMTLPFRLGLQLGKQPLAFEYGCRGHGHDQKAYPPQDGDRTTIALEWGQTHSQPALSFNAQ